MWSRYSDSLKPSLSKSAAADRTPALCPLRTLTQFTIPVILLSDKPTMSNLCHLPVANITGSPPGVSRLTSFKHYFEIR